MSRQLLAPVYKSKIGKGYSYPVGTQLLSEVLVNLPQYENLSLHFQNVDGWLMGGFSTIDNSMKWKGDIGDLLPVKDMISANYSHRSNKWSINIRRVQSDKKHKSREFLLNTGLPLVKAWMGEKRPETWYNGYRTFEIGLISDTNLYAVLEIQEVSSRQIINSYLAEILQ